MASVDLGSGTRKSLSWVLKDIWCCTMIPKDRETGSVWLPAEGAAIAGPLRGTILQRVPSWQCTWREWKTLYPETKVLVPPHEPRNPDERHGHGLEEFLGRPGVSGAFAYHTLAPPIDCQLPENEIVLAATVTSHSRVFPLREVRRAGGVVNTELDDCPIVVWANPPDDSFLMGAYLRPLDGGKVLSFEIRDGALTDAETGSTWTPTGVAISGPLEGTELRAVTFTLARWHAWAWSHLQTEVYRAPQPYAVPKLPAVLADILASLESAGFQVLTPEAIVNLQLPNEALAGCQARINDDRLLFCVFPDSTAARDYVFATRHCVQFGTVVVESSPDTRLCFRDSLQTKRLKDEELRWSPLVDPEDPVGLGFQQRIRATVRQQPASGGRGLADVVEGLQRCSFEIKLGTEVILDGFRSGRWMTELTRRQLRPDALSGYVIRIARDDFLLYKFASEEGAAAYAKEERHSIVNGRFVLRSTPRRMYKFPVWGFEHNPDNEIPWSKLTVERDFIEKFTRAVNG